MHADAEAKTSELKVLGQQGQRAKEEQQRLEQQLKELKVRQIPAHARAHAHTHAHTSRTDT